MSESAFFASGQGASGGGVSSETRVLQTINTTLESIKALLQDTKTQIDGIKSNTLNITELDRLRVIKPSLNFVSNQIYTSAGFAGFIHWIEPMPKQDKLLIPASFLSIGTGTGAAILLSDDGINFREVFKSTTDTENFALNAKDRGDLQFVSTGSSVNTNIVGSLYRSNDGGETWTKQLDSVDNRIYPIEITMSGAVVVGTTNNGAELATAGKIKRCTSPTATPMVWTDALISSYGIRSIVAMKSTSTLLAGGGSATGGAIYRSTDDGQSWQLMKALTVGEGKAVYWFHEDIDPFTGVVRIYAGSVASQIFESLDDGLTWTNVMSLVPPNSSLPSVLRRTTEYDGKYYAATQFGFYTVDFPNRRIKEFYSDVATFTNSQVFYNIVKMRGGLAVSFGDKIAFSGNIEPCAFILWSAKSVTTSGLTTSHFSTRGHNKKSVLINSNQSGTLTIQVLDRAGTPTLRDITPTVAITANQVSVVDLSTYAGMIFAIKFVPSVTATVDLVVALD